MGLPDDKCIGSMDDRYLKVKAPRVKYGNLPILPYSFLPYLPPQPCVFDAYRGTIGFDIFPFAITTRISAADEVFLKVYEDLDDPGQRQGL